jgi:DNA polymerase III subunit gamma/tau
MQLAFPAIAAMFRPAFSQQTMAYQVLARKYRPQRFADVAGQEHVTRTLLNALEKGRTAHGYIFSGHRGIGKTTVARILAMALNCRAAIGAPERPTAEPCGVCLSCQEIRAGNSVDMLEIDAATNRGIDEIRELRDAARYRPARDRYKIYLLDEAHQITDAAFNALLKILEEPPDHVVFMMATTQPEDIPQTIRSRCQHFSFHAVKFDDIVAEIGRIAEKEGILADDAALALLAESGDGSMRDALSIMDQALSSAPPAEEPERRPKLLAGQIRELMGSVPNTVFERLLENIHAGESAAVVEEINELLNAGNSPSQLARQLVRYLRNCLMAKLGGESTGLLQVSADERARAARSAAPFSEEDLTRFLDVMLRTFDELNYRQEQRFHFELGLLKLVHLERLIPLEQILGSLPAVSRPSAPPSARSAGMPAKAPPNPASHAVDLDQARDSVVAALASKGHNTAAGLLSAAHWGREESGIVRAKTGTTKTLLSLAMTPEALKIVHEALRTAGIAPELEIVPGDIAEEAPNPAPLTSPGSIQEVALGHPLVRQAQKLFRAEVRSVLDLRERSPSRDKE